MQFSPDRRVYVFIFRFVEDPATGSETASAVGGAEGIPRTLCRHRRKADPPPADAPSKRLTVERVPLPRQNHEHRKK